MIESIELTKRYGGRAVVQDVSFRCEPGTVTGFLGPNGAGKTTTMRMIVGLSRPDGGHATVLGTTYRELPNPGQRGVLLDASAQHAGRRGREALAVGAETIGAAGERADRLLELVGLDRSAARNRVRQYSLGMRQRLGIAHALLGEPEVLILDEPANGLDPEGMRWMRGLLRDFADRSGAVFLSSHLLHEVEAVADRLLIIRDGRLVAQGTRDELLAAAGTLVKATDERGLKAALERAGLSAHRADAGGLLVDAEPEAVGRAALAGGVALSHLAPSGRAGLEQLFFDRPPIHPRTPTGEGRAPAELRAAHAGRARQGNPGARAGFWLQFAVLALGVLVMLISALTSSAGDHNLRQLFSDTAQAVNALLPVVGILLVSSEWSQRRQITFTLVPRRDRVIASKLGAALVIALIAFVVAAARAARHRDQNPGLPGTWHVPLAQAGQVAFYLAVNMAIGVGFGALLLSSAPAIVELLPCADRDRRAGADQRNTRTSSLVRPELDDEHNRAAPDRRQVAGHVARPLDGAAAHDRDLADPAQQRQLTTVSAPSAYQTPKARVSTPKPGASSRRRVTGPRVSA